MRDSYMPAANVGTGLFHGYPVSGGMSQSAVNEQGGARSARSLVFASLATLWREYSGVT